MRPVEYPAAPYTDSRRAKPARRTKRRRHGCLSGLLLTAAVFGVLVFMFVRFFAAPTGYDGLQIAYNRTKCLRTPYTISYIVIHDTANPRSGADADSHYTFFNSGDQSSSADFFVDDTKALQVNDYYHYYTWHCGDGGRGAKIQNRNSVGVEICVNQDGNYAKALDNARQLTRRLMKELHVDVRHVVRHQDASGKNCPASMSAADWQAFLDSLTEG